MPGGPPAAWPELIAQAAAATWAEEYPDGVSKPEDGGAGGGLGAFFSDKPQLRHGALCVGGAALCAAAAVGAAIGALALRRGAMRLEIA
eukprot:gene15759-25927_t